MEEVKIAEDLLKGIEGNIKFFEDDIKKIRVLSAKIYDQVYQVVELAEEKYEEGQDYYGTDYLSQQLTWYEKRVLGELIDSNFLFEEMIPALENLSKILDEFIKELTL